MRALLFLVVVGGLGGCARDPEDLYDKDRDGHNNAAVDGGTDCDDTDADVYPGATEVCDGVDQDCDGVVDNSPADGQVLFVDEDGDGFGGAEVVACAVSDGVVAQGGDCDEGDAQVHPDASEACNGVDDDCAGGVDNGLVVEDWYADVDGDGFGDDADSLRSCAPLDGRVRAGGDCDDSDAAVNPSASEQCNGVDDDCAGGPDNGLATEQWYLDADGDGYGLLSDGVPSCVALDGRSQVSGDCDDADPNVNPGASEICNGVDDDCTGGVDNGLTMVSYYADSDGDGFGGPSDKLDSCEEPAGYVADDSDCDDTNDSVRPTATEVWYDGVDQDCDGQSDFDQDGDGSDAEEEGGEDCDDTAEAIGPHATEICNNGVDEDCQPSGPECAVLGTLDASERDGVMSGVGGPISAASADMDGDGLRDVVFALESGLWMASGSGAMPGAIAQLEQVATGQFSQIARSDDLDGDGVADLVMNASGVTYPRVCALLSLAVEIECYGGESVDPGYFSTMSYVDGQSNSGLLVVTDNRSVELRDRSADGGSLLDNAALSATDSYESAVVRRWGDGNLFLQGLTDGLVAYSRADDDWGSGGSLGAPLDAPGSARGAVSATSLEADDLAFAGGDGIALLLRDATSGKPRVFAIDEFGVADGMPVIELTPSGSSALAADMTVVDWNADGLNDLVIGQSSMNRVLVYLAPLGEALDESDADLVISSSSSSGVAFGGDLAIRTLPDGRSEIWVMRLGQSARDYYIFRSGSD